MLTQVEAYVNGTFNLVKNLPQEVATLPRNVSPPCARTCLHMPAHANMRSCLTCELMNLPCLAGKHSDRRLLLSLESALRGTMLQAGL